MGAEMKNIQGTVGYLKGRARMENLLLLLHINFKLSFHLRDVHPALFTSVLRIYAHHLPQSSRREEALSNMQISCKGSLRKAPNIVTISKMSCNLKAVGDADFQSFVKLWNERAPRMHKITGQKAIGLKYLLEVMQPELLELVLEHVGSEGWVKCAFSDDNLGNKKIYPPTQYPAKGKVWLARLKVTHHTMSLHFQHLIHEHENSPAYLKRKQNKQDMEKLAERAAAVYHCGQEVLQLVPACTIALIEKYIYNPYIVGEGGLHVEMTGAILEKSDTFNLRELTAVKELIKKLTGAGNFTSEEAAANLMKAFSKLVYML